MKELEHLGGLENELGKEILGEMLKADMLVKEALEVSFQNSDIDKIAQISQKIEAKAYDGMEHETLAQINAAISDKLQMIQELQNRVNHIAKIEKEMEKLLGRMGTLDLRGRSSEQIIMDPNFLECQQCLIPPPSAST